MPRHTPLRVVIVTLDNHLAGAVDRARARLRKQWPGLVLSLHASSDWESSPELLEKCRDDIAQGDIVIATMLFLEPQINAVLPALEARRDDCDALVCAMSAGEVVKLTRIGAFVMDGSGNSATIKLLRKLRGSAGKDSGGTSKDPSKSTAGARQMAMLRHIPKLLKFIPGTAQDVRAYFMVLQYWLAGSDQNIENMVRFLVGRYASGEREGMRKEARAVPPVEYPETGLYHPGLKRGTTCATCRTRNGCSAVTDSLSDLPLLPARKTNGTVGVLVMRSYVLACDTAHYDGVIRALEAKGLNVIAAFASGLDARPAVDAYFGGVDAVVSLTGFSLVGGPAYNDVGAAEAMLTELDVPCFSAHPLEFQTLESWHASEQGLQPVESTMMVAIPELDGAVSPTVFGGRREATVGTEDVSGMQPDMERVEVLAARVARTVRLRNTPRAERKLAVSMFSFPPNAGNIGTAAYLSVYASLFNTLKGLKAAGYTVDLPDSVDDLRDRVLKGNAQTLGTPANVCARIPVDDHVRSEPWLDAIEKEWGPAPGKQLTDGRSLFVLGAEFGNVLLTVQPGMGYEGDPMRLMYEHGCAPTHAFSAYYRYLREDYAAHAVLHFGTHGSLEFMPGKQTGLGADCWPERMLGDLPNYYLYAANNPSEGALAKRRSAATLVSHLTPTVAHAGLYKGLEDLKSTLERWRALPPSAPAEERASVVELVALQAAEVDLADAQHNDWAGSPEADRHIERIIAAVAEAEDALIPFGLHVVGEPAPREERLSQLGAMSEASFGSALPESVIEAINDGAKAAEVLAAMPGERAEALDLDKMEALSRAAKLLASDHEVAGIIRALDARFVPPVAGGDLLRNPDVLPTGRNLHGFDPFRIPSAYAVRDGARQADLLLERHAAEGKALPESVALVLWGTDNLKSEGGPIGQALWLLGARPRFDSYGRLAGAELMSLQELGRPRIDVLVTLSGIFRDLLPLQTRMLAEAAWLAASADEADADNFVAKHVRERMAESGCDLETAALRVFSNADGAYGSNVNLLVDSGAFQDDDELGDAYARRKCFAYGRAGKPVQQAELLQSVLAKVDLAYQNLESVELGVTSVDHYFDTLGGIGRAVATARGEAVPVYIGDQTRGDGAAAKVRTLEEQVALEARSRILNPKWYEAMLEHGYEGVRHVEQHVTNTMGWSATTGQVEPWVYQQISQTFVLDPAMRERIAELNPTASANVANRLIEACERNYWSPSEETLEALREAGDELEDRVEGVGVPALA